MQDAIREKIRLQEETAELRERIRSRRSNVNNQQTETANVTINIGVAGDPEGTARVIRDVMADSFNRGTGGLVGAF
jgi:hypothetical protein